MRHSEEDTTVTPCNKTQPPNTHTLKSGRTSPRSVSKNGEAKLASKTSFHSASSLPAAFFVQILL